MAGWVARSLAAALVLGCTALLALTSTISTTVRLLSNAYVMDGTTFPTPSPGFVQAAINGFIVPTVGGSYTGIALTTPEQIVGINQSVRTGLATCRPRWPSSTRPIRGNRMWCSATRKAP